MIEFYKKRGETPLQALTRLRIENPEFKTEILSYAGRLDPMAEGILPVLIGREENQKRKDFLHKDKIYKATFLCGISTDTHDVLGIIQKKEFNKKISEEKIKSTFEYVKQLKEQVYPWYSSQTVNGKALFEYAREGNFDIKRPSKKVTIYDIQDISIQEILLKDVVEEIIIDIQKVEGDFRQEEIIKGWENIVEAGRPQATPLLQAVSCTLKVSSGTYIRGLCEILEEELDVPVLLYKLIRTKIV